MDRVVFIKEYVATALLAIQGHLTVAVKQRNGSTDSTIDRYLNGIRERIVQFDHNPIRIIPLRNSPLQLEPHVIRWIGGKAHIVHLLQLNDRNKPCQSFIQGFVTSPLPLLEAVGKSGPITTVKGEIGGPHDPGIEIRSDAFILQCTEIVSLAVVAVDGWDSRATGCVVSDL